MVKQQTRLEKAKAYIQKNWFKDHQVKVKEGAGITTVAWAQPKSGMYAVAYILADRKLFVSGDIGDAVFDLNWDATIESFHNIDLDYFMSKLSCSSRASSDIDKGLAMKEIEEWETFNMEGLDHAKYEADRRTVGEIAEKMRQAVIESETRSELEWEVYIIGEKYVDFLTKKEIRRFEKFGQKIPSVFIAYWLGLQMINEQLKNNGKREAV